MASVHEPIAEVFLNRSYCACAAMRRASRAMTQLYDAVLQPTGLKATQFIMLQAVEDAGEIAQHQFAADNAVAVETLSRRFANVRTAGYVSVRKAAKGERIYSLTPLGRAKLKEALPYWRRAQERLLQVSSAQEFASIIECANRVTRIAQQALEVRLKNAI